MKSDTETILLILLNGKRHEGTAFPDLHVNEEGFVKTAPDVCESRTSRTDSKRYSPDYEDG